MKYVVRFLFRCMWAILCFGFIIAFFSLLDFMFKGNVAISDFDFGFATGVALIFADDMADERVQS